MGKPFWRSVEYFFTGNYSADDGNNSIVAIGFGGEIHAYGGDDHVTVGSIGATVYTGSGNDTVVGGSAYLRVEDTTGHLSVKGAAGYADINKSGDGNVSFAGAAGGVSIDHLGNHGDVNYGGAAAYNGITRKGLSGNVTFKGAGGYNALWHETNQGNLSFAGAGAGNKLDRTWFNRYQDSRGDVTFDGAGAANSISSRVETGNITFRGAGADNHLVRKGKVGDVTLQGAGASNRIERTRQAEDVYAQTRGNIRFEGVGGYNSLYSDVAHGDIHFSGGGAYNTITRKGSGSSFDAQGMEYAKAEEIVLTAAQMHGLSIDNGNKFHAVTAVKSEREPNTYLFAIADGTYTKINKVRLYNDPETGKLKYYSEAWFKRGNHLTDLARSDVSSAGGFEVNPINGGYTLSNIAVEHQQSLTVHAVEKDLTEYEWVTYANGALIDAKDVALSEAKMGGTAISTDGTTVDVQAVKSNRKPNTYVYAKVLGPYTKIVVVELANDPKTGALKYQARSWYKEGNHTADLANEDISSANGYHSMGKGGYSLSDLHYSVNAVRSTSETVADIDEYTDQTLFKPATDSGESSGDVHFNGAGGGNVIKSNVTRGNVYFNGGGIANVILHSSQFGNTEFNGGGAANVIVKSGEEGDLTFRGAGLANVLVHQSKQGKMDVYAGGAVNVLVRIGDGQYLAHLLAYGNISVHKGNGNSRVVMLGGYNTHTQIGSGNGLWLAAGGFNVMTQVGKGDVASVLAGGANVLTKVGDGDLTAGMLGGANVITHISGDNETSNTTAVALGGANILTKKGKGNALAVMGGGANVLTHVGDGTTTGVMVGGANILTKVGNGDTTGIMLGVGNVLTHVGDGQTLGVMGAAGNIFTKVGDGTSIAVMIGAGNIFTHVGEGNAWALMGGLGNVFTKVGNGDALALMVAEANVFTHIGDGMSVALMLAKGNVATKVGNGTTLAAMVGNANIFTHVGSGSTFAAMIGQANIMTKVGDDLTAALMVGKANIYTHVGDGTSLGIFAGEVNVMTKVGNGTTLAAMFGKANIMTHVGDGLTGVLALGEANIVTKVGDDFMGVVAAAKANVVTHVGDATTAAVLAGKGNILTKVGEGTTVGLLISDIGNVMTHVGDGTTIGIAKGKANIITKVGDGLGVNVAWGQANVFTQVGDGDRYNFAKGEANVITKVGDGQEVSVVQGKANIITHVGNGDDYTGAWGKANVITKVGNGRNVVLAKGEANIVTQVGDGDSFNALWSKGNIVTKVGDGMQVTAAKGKANITTTVGDGLSVTAAYGDANINTKVGDGVSVNVAWGKYNINTKVGDGLNVAVMKGKANANIHIGDGLGINASYAQNNVAIKIGNGDFYSLAVASSNTSSNKLSALFDNIKQTVLGVGGSQAINYLVQGDEASSSGTQKGRGAIATPEITKLDGFQMDAIEEVGSDLGDSLTGSVTKVDTPDLNKMQNALNVDGSSDQTQATNLIVNGDFEQGDQGWKSTHGVEASYSGNVYGVNGEGHGARVTELDTYTNTSLYQDLTDLTEGEVIAVSFDFAKRAGLSNNEGIEVLWNGEVVFSSSGDASAWQQKTLKLTAHAGSNRIEFKGTGQNDGLGYILDNVVAKSESSQQANAVSEHATQNQASQNALSDKERAEADRQRLEQEKQKQLDAVAGSQSQLESTDQQALENNGQAQRDAVKEESEAVTAELTKLAQGLDVLDEQATHTGESGDQWRNDFAGDLLDGVQRQLDDAKQLANDKIAAAKQTQSDNNSKVKESVAKSEAGVAKGEQNRAGAEQDIADAKADAETRQADAMAKSNDAKEAESDAHSVANDAQSRGDRDAMNAENKANQAQNDAKGTKQNEGDRPDREGVTGSGLSGNAHRVEGAGETGSHVTNDSQTNADGRFSEGLSEQEQEALEGATNAVNRLQINAGIRGKNSGSTISSMFAETNSDSIVVPTAASQDVVRKEIRISGVNLEGLGEASHDTAESLVSARAEKVANLYRWLDTDNDAATDKYVPVPGFERVDADVSDEAKERMIQFVGGYIEHTDNQVPKDQAQALATLFVEATLDYDWDKRVEFLTKLESYGYSFEAPHGEKSIVSFWSGRNFKEYRNVLDNAQADGKKVVYDIDVKGNAFAIDLNKQLMRWGGMFLDPDNAEQNQLKSSIDAATFSNTGFWSSVYATGAQNDVYVIAEGGMRLGNYFWNVELPALRQLQREGLVGEIRLLDKPVSAYKDIPVEDIGRRLTDAGVAVKVRFDALSHEKQADLLADNPDGYKADTLVELDVKLSAIDSMLRESLPFYSLRTERNLLVQEGEEGFEVRSWPGTDGKSKTILLDNPEDAAQQKSIERFILANFDNFEQMPDELFLVDNKVLSHHDGRTRILAQKEDGAWTYNANVELMSVTELLDAAHVSGKVRGESYQQVIDALTEYHASTAEHADYELTSVEKLLNLRKQVEGYVLGHPDSGRVQAMNALLNQVNSRLEAVSVLVVSEQSIKAHDSFSHLYDQLDNANLKESKHLYLDGNGDFVTKGKGNLANIDKLGGSDAVLEKVKAAVSHEYGQVVADTIFAGLSANDLAKDGKGIDIAGLNKVHQAIEQHMSPVSATMYIWKPSDHSALGHAALQIGQGRTQLEGQAAADFNKQNYVSWWPLGSKSSNIRNIFNVATEDQPDLKLRWSDFSQPAHQNDTLEHDMASEENDGFGLNDGETKLKRFIEKLNAAKGIDASYKDASEGYASVLLGNPDMLASTGIPAHVFQPFVDQWNDTSYDMMDVANRFAEELQKQAQASGDPALVEKRIDNVVRLFAERALEEIEAFKASQADEGRVFRINLEGLDVAAMQAEWNRLSNDPDARYQLLTKNCSSTVAKVLKAGGADKLIGHTWRPKFGVWTPTELFNFGQALQEAQLEIAAKKQSHQATDLLDALSGNEKHKENVAIENDGTPPRDKESLSPLTRFLNNELYGEKDARRKIGDITQTLLDHAVENGESQKVTLKGEAGRLTGYYHQGAASSEGETSATSGKVVLFLHGSGSSAEEQASAIRNHYQKQGIDMLAVNLRGYGESDGGPSEKGLYQDARTMFNYLVNDKGIDPSNIIIHGYSMGGPIAADLARYAAQNGQAVSGLLLDRPMPSMTKAITAHEVANPAGIVGAIAKAVNGQFSVEKNLKGLPKETPILLLTDNEGLGEEGEKLRAKLAIAGYNVTGEQTFYGHEASNRLMGQYADQIVSGLFNAEQAAVEVKDIRATEDLSVVKTVASDTELGTNTDAPHKNYQSRDLVLEPIVQPETIELGMPDIDQKILAEVAERENVIIGVRPVDEKSKSLIDSKLYSSKGLFVKAKSSDWGPMSGFIPVDQAFAKASARRDLDKFNDYAEQSIESGNAVSADLYLNQVRIDELVSKYQSLTTLEFDAESGMYKTTATNGDQTVTFFLNKVTVDSKDLWQVHYIKDGKLAPFKVIGDPVSKQPMTADYDLLTVMYSYSDLGPQDKVKQPLTWEQWKESVTYEELTPKYKELYNSEVLYNKKDGASLGVVSDRLKALKDVINTSLGRTDGLEMVHHGADDANPYAVMADNFPATFFVPKSFFMEDGLGEGKGSIQTYFNVNEQGAVVIRDPQEFSNFQQVAINVSYRASLNDKWNVGLDDPLFTPKRKLSHDFLNAKEEVVKKLSGEVEDLDQQRLDTTSTKDQGTSDKNDHLQVVDSKEALADGKILHNQNVNDWERVVVTPTADGGETRFDGQIIVQMENDAVAAKAAANLAGKHPESSVVVQLDSDGNYRVVYGDPSKLDGKLRWQLVGHGRDHSESNNTRLSGYSADELAVKLASFQQMFNQAEKISSKPDHISIVGCSLVSDDKQKGFGHQFINAMDANGLRVDVSVRSAKVYINEMGRKLYFDGKDSWVNKAINSKVLLSWNGQGEVVAKDERIRNGIAEGDIDLSRIGISDVDEPARGAIGDNNDVFDAPEKRKAETETSSSSANNKLSYSGNIQVNVGDGEFTAVNWGTSNVGIKVGTGGFKSLAFGDNNVMVHIGNGESKHSFDIGGYQALEGAQMFIGNRNVSFNLGRSNDLIVMMDKSIPTPPLVNPFDGAARISGVLQSIATSGEGQDWLAAQEQQWTLSGAKKFVKDMSGLDQSSSVDYTSLVELDSQNERSSRGLKHDAEAALNKQYNQWLSGNSDSDTSKLSRADKLRQANEKLAFNFAVGGQGADIQVTTGNWNFMFGDNIQSILDTNLGSLFGLMTQQFSATGQAKTTFTYTPEDLPRQLKNKLLGQLAGVGAETTLADIFGVDYTASGHIVSRNGEAVDGVAILKEMLEVIGEFSGDQLQAFVDPAKLLDSLKAGIKTGADGIKSFAETHGLKEKAPEEEESKPSVSLNGESLNSTQGATVADGSTETTETPDRAFGFNSLNLPNLFATIFSQDKQKEMKSLVENLKENLTADLLNMKEKTFDFLRNSGHLQGDGDINISLGNYNFNWGGDGKDLGAYLGDNNNFWGGRGDDVFYATGTSNIFTGGEGNDMGVLMGRENMMFGGDGNDTAVVAGRINHVFLGAGDDQSFVFGEGGEIDTGSGRDYVVTSGNFNRVDTGDDQDYSVTIGNNNQVELGAGDDFANVFGNYNRINASAGNDVVKLMGYHAVLNGGEGEDHLIAAAISKFSQFNGGEGRDLMVLGGYQNTFKGGTDVDSFVVSGDVIDNLVEDIRSEDNIVFNGIDWQKLWFERSGYDLKLSILRDPASDSDQAKFEHIGSVTFSDYFNGNRAQVIIAMGEKDATGEREYTTLSESAIDALVQAMSGFDPQAGDNGFIDNLDSKSRVAITTAWADVVHKKGITV
ncbi:MARTX multifunctional-autoprocessing repeats-in-toxin holotoxin RtxA [Vibrio vulnificus]|nr:MARTX multifunctional-autoprocessing repeats-in-toxin holotoxin RtxA [Vibrio vulnificus]MCD1420480.1 MARTX multifunctional-autoprocessing repeats-in-toxin holotoxin RtxA [Vibrio vulnificus]MCD1425272.1 MARTX multifunctional-autoprocessing repeats-in-toxin holotoxin RtxA [Vibrio vulnificus]MCD1440004.1 MARTX multifunctional-autoprocessing repeats-in-toxin holotoxin RtxA [Vibrio vulnificus]MCD1444509.1 MARTX multifunctional-autoprocessing repeats-in-toxin holotoxin RtxA [Vibrio vulnificus]